MRESQKNLLTNSHETARITALKDQVRTTHITIRAQGSRMIRVTLSDLARVPVERLAQLLLEWAAEDHSLLGRLHATVSETSGADSPIEPPPPAKISDIVGNSAAMQHVAGVLDRYAKTDEPVLITGES